jgi:two-component system chemotaxis sensor kinase CheA
MTASDDRWDELRATFSVELDERVPELNRLLLRLEQESEGGLAPEIVDALFREAHSLKGAARAVQLPEVEGVAHALESGLEELRRRGAAPDPSWFDAAYRAVDALKPLYLTAGSGKPSQDLDLLVEGLSSQPDDAGGTIQPSPQPSPTGFGPDSSPRRAPRLATERRERAYG